MRNPRPSLQLNPTAKPAKPASFLAAGPPELAHLEAPETRQPRRRVTTGGKVRCKRHIYLSEETDQALQNLAGRSGRDLSHITEAALRLYIPSQLAAAGQGRQA